MLKYFTAGVALAASTGAVLYFLSKSKKAKVASADPILSDPLVLRAIEKFRNQFNAEPEFLTVAPGRVNLIGEHTDYNDGFVCPMAIQKKTVVVGRANGLDRFRIVSDNVDFNERSVEFALADISPKSKPSWANYVKGVIAVYAAEEGVPIPSFDAAIESDVPLGGGLSSSASLEVAVATLLEQLMSLSHTGQEIALRCQKAEHQFAGVPCGIMDQFISALAKEGHALLIDCRTLQPLDVCVDDGRHKVTVLITNSNKKHELSGGEYKERRQQCEEAAHILAQTFPQIKNLRDATMVQLDQVKDKLSEVCYRRAKHVIEENERTARAADLLKERKYEQVGELMRQSHASLRDLYNVSTEELDLLVKLASEIDGVYGARMTGGGFGGCIVSLVKTSAVPALIKHLDNDYFSLTGIRPTSFPSLPSRGAFGMRLPSSSA